MYNWKKVYHDIYFQIWVAFINFSIILHPMCETDKKEYHIWLKYFHHDATSKEENIIAQKMRDSLKLNSRMRLITHPQCSHMYGTKPKFDESSHY